jgi:hypothetical protein
MQDLVYSNILHRVKTTLRFSRHASDISFTLTRSHGNFIEPTSICKHHDLYLFAFYCNCVQLSSSPGILKPNVILVAILFASQPDPSTRIVMTSQRHIRYHTKRKTGCIECRQRKVKVSLYRNLKLMLRAQKIRSLTDLSMFQIV